MKNKLMLLFNNQHTLVVNWAKVLLFANILPMDSMRLSQNTIIFFLHL